MALELHIFTSREFFRLGAHGELDWTRSLAVLSTLVRGFMERGTDLAIVDVRDTHTTLSDEQIDGLVQVLEQGGLQPNHRVAILNRPRPERKAPAFVAAARDLGFDIAEFVDYEEAVEWLSRSEEPDPDFDRETYGGPGGQASPGARPTGGA
jgi:hypothetical protein